MSQPATLNWFARHELTLFWRDWLSMMSAGRSAREGVVKLVLGLAAIGLHGLAYSLLAEPLSGGFSADKAKLVMLTGSLALAFFMMMSQSLEAVTRAFYTRADLDLILSSPAPVRHVFAIRIGTITLTSAAMATVLAAPFINVAAVLDGPHWLAAYPAMLALSAIATALSILAVVTMLHYVGAARTRLISQIIAAIVGASFLIGIQIVAILSTGSMSRFSVLSSQSLIAAAPDLTSLLWLPAYALIGTPWALASLSLGALVLLVGVIHLVSPRFAHYSIATAGLSQRAVRQAGRSWSFKRRLPSFARRTPRQVLRAKELMLLKRDPWLVSQTLMQILYLIPPAIMLWKNFGESASGFVIVAPVLVMAIGQLAGGLSWLAISGEDAPDLIASAPLHRRAVLVAKIEAVLSVITLIGGPILLVMAIASPWAALMTCLGVLAASTAAIAIQMWFRAAAKRSNFRRRQTSSRAATFSEAFSSVMWAGAASLAVAGSGFAALFAALALLVLGFAWVVSLPRQGG